MGKTSELHVIADVDLMALTGSMVYAGALEQPEGHLQAPGLSQTAPVLTRSVWQCGSGYTELTEQVTLLEFDLAQLLCSSQGRSKARYSLLPSQHHLTAWQDIHSLQSICVWIATECHCGVIHILSKIRLCVQVRHVYVGNVLHVITGSNRLAIVHYSKLSSFWWNSKACE